MVISPDEYRRLNRLNVEEFLSFCDAAGAVAEQNGMTEAVLDGGREPAGVAPIPRNPRVEPR